MPTCNPVRLTVLLLLAASLPAQVRVTYLANEGVMLSSEGGKVLVDALFRDSLEDYARHDAATLESLETGRPPFDGIGVALATHFHLDHWDAGSVSRFLRSNPKALFASTPPGVAMIPSSLKPRARALWPGEPAGVTLSLRGVEVAAFPLQHGAALNLGYRIRMGGSTLVHLGDADTVASNFDTLIAQGSVDVAFIPFWWLLSGDTVRFIEQRWKPRHVVALHLGANDVMQSAQKLRSTHPKAWICTHAGEVRVF